MSERNSSIDIFRFISAIMVIAIHTHPFSEINQFLSELILTISRLSVPFFFATSGYYFVKRFKKGTVLVPYLLRITKSYCIWSCIYFALDFIKWGHENLKGFIINSVYSFFVLGSHYHLWYIVALFSSMCITAFFLRNNKENLLLLISATIFVIGIFDFGIISSITNSNFFRGLPYFTLGLLISKIETHNMQMTTFLKTFICILFIGIWAFISLLHIIPEGFISLGLYVVVCILLITLLCHPLPQLQVISQKCRFLSDFTYYSHPLFIEILKPIVLYLFKINISETLTFAFTVCLSWFIGSCIIIAKKARPQIKAT